LDGPTLPVSGNMNHVTTGLAFGRRLQLCHAWAEGWQAACHDASSALIYWPASSDRSSIRADAAVMDKTYGVITISWPTPS
jgi:hypothetical protein